MLGKLTLEAIPYHEPIVMVTLAAVCLGGLAVFGAVTYFGKWKYLWTEWLTSVDHKRIGVMYIIVALIMLLRGFADAIMMRTQLAVRVSRLGRLPATAPLRPDLHRPRRHHDFLHGDALHHRADEHRGAAADRRPRRGLPVPELAELLAVRRRRRADDGLAVRGRIRRDRLARVSAALRAGLQSKRGGGLLHLGAPDIRVGHNA